MYSVVITLSVGGKKAVRLEPYTIYRIGRKPELEFYAADESMELAHATISLLRADAVRLSAVLGKIWLNGQEQSFFDLTAQNISDGHVKLRFGNVEAKLEVVQDNGDGEESETVGNTTEDSSYISETSSDSCFIPETESEISDQEISQFRSINQNLNKPSGNQQVNQNNIILNKNLKKLNERKKANAESNSKCQYQPGKMKNIYDINHSLNSSLPSSSDETEEESINLIKPCVVRNKNHNQKVSQIGLRYTEQKLDTKRRFESKSPPAISNKKCRFTKLPQEILQFRDKAIKPQEIDTTSAEKINEKINQKTNDLARSKLDMTADPLQSIKNYVKSKKALGKIKIALSMCNLEILDGLLKALNNSIEVTTDPLKCHVLIMDKGELTYKFLIAIAANKPILSTQWLHFLKESLSIDVHSNHLFNDPKFENHFTFNPQFVMEKPKIFKNINFVLSQGIQPNELEMKTIIESAGGKIHSTISSVTRDELFYVITTIKQVKPYRLMFSIYDNVKYTKPEGVIQALLQRNLNLLNDFQLNF